MRGFYIGVNKFCIADNLAESRKKHTEKYELLVYDYVHACWRFVSYCSSLRIGMKHAKDYVRSRR